MVMVELNIKLKLKLKLKLDKYLIDEEIINPRLF